MLINICKYFFFVGIALYFFSACNNKPEYSSTPQIELIEAKKISLPNGSDSLLVRLKFKDGDGDLGLNLQDLPTSEYTFIRDNNGNLIPMSANDTYNCENYAPVDTGRINYKIIRDPNYFNLNFTYYQKASNGTYKPIALGDCRTNNGRFTRFDPDNNYSGPLEGEIKYSFSSRLSSLSAFKKHIIQIRVSIQDRAFHRSNEIITQDFQF